MVDVAIVLELHGLATVDIDLGFSTLWNCLKLLVDHRIDHRCECYTLAHVVHVRQRACLVALTYVDILDHVFETLVELEQKLGSHFDGCKVIRLKSALFSEEVFGDFKVTNTEATNVSVFESARDLLVKLRKNLLIFIRLELLDFL